MTERKLRADYELDRNRKMARASIVDGLSYTKIAFDPILNPDGITPQRIHQIVLDYVEKFGEDFKTV